MVSGISHLTFIVRDLDRMEEILCGVLGARRVYDSGLHSHSLAPERFFLVGEGDAEIWIAIMQGEPLSARSYNHIAFKIGDSAYAPCLERIYALGLEVRQSRPRVIGEGQSIYFHDDDNHLFELHTGTLKDRLEACRAMASEG